MQDRVRTNSGITILQPAPGQGAGCGEMGEFGADRKRRVVTTTIRAIGGGPPVTSRRPERSAAPEVLSLSSQDCNIACASGAEP